MVSRASRSARNSPEAIPSRVMRSIAASYRTPSALSSSPAVLPSPGTRFMSSWI
jgi:hypothetical protein